MTRAVYCSFRKTYVGFSASSERRDIERADVQSEVHLNYRYAFIARRSSALDTRHAARQTLHKDAAGVSMQKTCGRLKFRTRGHCSRCEPRLTRVAASVCKAGCGCWCVQEADELAPATCHQQPYKLNAVTHCPTSVHAASGQQICWLNFDNGDINVNAV